MREAIKFRAWFTLENKMVEHENLSLQYDNNEGFTFAFDNLAIIDDEHIKGTLNFELMQYTNVLTDGDSDDDGVTMASEPIYEGDLINWLYEREYITVEVVKEGPGFMLVSDQIPDGYIWMTEICEVEEGKYYLQNSWIVGNKYEGVTT